MSHEDPTAGGTPDPTATPDPAGTTDPTATPAVATGPLLERAAADRPCPAGGVILAATPLGDPLDASVRLLDALATADVVAAEDTRRTRALADALGVTLRGRVVSNLAATPLGDPLDASVRLLDALATADVVAAEDTR
ncbi:hypothetical protein MTQ19_00080, partial [Corynebacterium bovis]